MAIIENTVTDETGQPVVVRIEVTENLPEYQDEEDGRITRGSATDKAKDAFNDAMQLINTCLVQVATTIRKVPPELQPKEFEVQFSIKVDGKAKAFIAESTVGALLQVTLKWGEKEQK